MTPASPRGLHRGARQHFSTQTVRNQRKRRPATMTEETVSATTTTGTAAETVSAVLADPSRHAAIDGTGWVCDSLDGQRLTGSGQVFRMVMYPPNPPEDLT